MTSNETLYDLFFKRIEKDEDFFNYYDVPSSECMEIAKERANTYLGEAIGMLILKCQPSVDFTDKNSEGFNLDFNQQELLLVPSLMYEMYLNRDVAYLAVFDVNFTSTDLKVFSPSDARTSFLALYNRVCKENDELMDLYKNTDRDTGKFLSINFSAYDTSD